MTKAKKITVGSQVTIPAGTQITVRGEKTKRQTSSQVTVRRLDFTKTGNTRVSWKSNGYMATAILKS